MNRLYFGFEIEVVQIIALLHWFSLYFECLRGHILTFMPFNILNYLLRQIWLKQLLFVLLSTSINFGQQKLIFSSLSEVLTCHTQLFLGNNINFYVLLRATIWIKWRLDVLSHDHTSACSNSLSLLVVFFQYLMGIAAVLVNYWIHFWDDAALMPGVSRVLPIIARHWTLEKLRLSVPMPLDCCIYFHVEAASLIMNIYTLLIPSMLRIVIRVLTDDFGDILSF